MKKSICLLLGLFSLNNLIAQDLKVETDDGKIVILKQNKTWYYESEGDKILCDTKQDLIKPSKKLRSHVAIEQDVDESKIKFINTSNGNWGNDMWTLCVDGVKMKYKLMGTIFTKFEN